MAMEDSQDLIAKLDFSYGKSFQEEVRVRLGKSVLTLTNDHF